MALMSVHWGLPGWGGGAGSRHEPSRVLGYPSAGQRWKDSEQLKCFAWELFGAFFFFFLKGEFSDFKVLTGSLNGFVF